MQSTFLNNVVYSFLISFGVILGASMFAGVAALINNHPPLKTMLDIAASIKVWAVAIALGGTFSSFEIIEKGIFNGELKTTLKQAIFVVTALFGANAGYHIIKLIQRCGEIWME